MDRREFIILASATAGLALLSACGAADSVAPTIDPNVEPEVIEWSIGPKGGLNEGSAFITQYAWEPKRVEAPVGRPFKIRFVPRDKLFHPIVFGTSLKDEVGFDLPALEIRDGQPAETPVMVINTRGKAFDVFCREHRGINGFGSVITPV